jgi:hypothetical protein
MSGKKLTTYVILAIIALIAIYDVFIIATEGKEVSISWVMIEWSYKYPSFSFLMGFTMGHLFWRMKDPTKKEDK